MEIALHVQRPANNNLNLLMLNVKIIIQVACIFCLLDDFYSNLHCITSGGKMMS